MNLLEKFMAKYGRAPTEFDPDYLEMLNMSKYRILDRPDKMNAKCANCGSTKDDGRKYVDFGLEVDWYGIVYLCGICIKEIAKALGVLESLVNRMKVLETENKTLTNLLIAQGDELRNAVEVMTKEVTEYFDAVDLHANGISSSSDVADPVADRKESDESTDDANERSVIENTGKSSESNSESGPKNIPSIAELLKSATK